jgi:outer membrane receptor protein involved in Fe transport
MAHRGWQHERQGLKRLLGAIVAGSNFRAALLGATFLAGGMATGASAQTAPAPAEQLAQADGQDADSANEIVVTGNRRSVTLQNAPINISAIGAEQLQRQHVDDIRDLAAFTPGLTISDTGPRSTGSIVLRGLNASDTSAEGGSYDNALGVYLGEVPLYYDFKFLDIARVETLLGPQGTLYGLGTLAGAIRYIPNRPNVTDIEGEVHGRFYGKSHGSKAGYQGDGVINIPIVRDHIDIAPSLARQNQPVATPRQLAPRQLPPLHDQPASRSRSAARAASATHCRITLATLRD